jgi:hypothetical protein
MNSHHIVIPTVIALSAAEGSAQVSQWESKNEAGIQAFRQRSYADAENFFTSAFHQAEQFGHRDPRFATSLNTLASEGLLRICYGIRSRCQFGMHSR